MPFTNYFDQSLILNAIGRVPYTFPSTFYVGLSTTPPSQIQVTAPGWGFTEPVGNGYSRVPVLNDTTHWGPISPQPATGYTVQNLMVVSYQQSSGPWSGGATLGFFGCYDALTAGNLLWFGSCAPAQSVPSANVTLSFAVNALTSTLN